MSWTKAQNSVIRERGDDTTRTVTTYDAAGAVLTTRPYTPAENAADDAAAAEAATLTDLALPPSPTSPSVSPASRQRSGRHPPHPPSPPTPPSRPGHSVAVSSLPDHYSRTPTTRSTATSPASP